MFPTGSGLSASQNRLLKFYRRLTEGDKESLLAFAEFLAGRAGERGDALADGKHPLEPKAIARPPEESVIAAIKRLSETFYMLDRSDMLNETSTLMSSHVLQGRPAAEVIDDLEVMFQRSYDHYKSNSQEN